jgi:hypothetical protein
MQWTEMTTMMRKRRRRKLGAREGKDSNTR